MVWPTTSWVRSACTSTPHDVSVESSCSEWSCIRCSLMGLTLRKISTVCDMKPNEVAKGGSKGGTTTQLKNWNCWANGASKEGRMRGKRLA